MKDSMKITVKYQFVYMLLMQVAASGVGSDWLRFGTSCQ